MSDLKSSKFIELGVFVTMFLKDHQDDIDENFLQQMSDLALDYHISQEGEVPVIFPSILIEEWKDDGVVVREKSVKELFDRGETQSCEFILAKLYGLKPNYLSKFSDLITETLIEVYTHGDTDKEQAESND